MDYCKTKGIEILPDDMRFIEQMLKDIPDDLHKSIMRDFIEEWCDGMGRDAMSLLKQNLGRRKANIWLRAKVGKILGH
jgi:hypothetical protein